MYLGKIYCLLGKSACGKSTLEKVLERMGHNRIISYTTRPKRPHEVDGIDYHFITLEEFEKMRQDDEFLECQEYRQWFYGIKNDLDLENQDYVCVIEPRGFFQIKEKLGCSKVIPMYIYVGDLELSRRGIARATTNEEANEFNRRFHADKPLFDGFEKQCVYKFHNIDVNDTAMFIDKVIRRGGR